VLFVTGKLAEPALRRTLAQLGPDFAYDVAVLKISVAALMTAPWIARFLKVPPGTDLVLIPGLCEGDPAVIAEQVGVPVDKGPKDLREIPEYFGRRAAAQSYGAWDIEIVAEINNAPRLARQAIRDEAAYFRASGADLIDIGCTPGREFPELPAVVQELVGAGFRVSIDSLEPHEIHRAVDAGAELVLSITGANIEAARDLAGTTTRVVVIPDTPRELDTLDPTVAALERWGVRYLIDPIIEPIGVGFLASLERFLEVRRRYPTAALFMGVANITELTEADTTGVNAILMAICQELGVRTVLTTEVIPWARGAVRELDIARRLMHHAVTEGVLPKGLDDRLVTLHDPKILAYDEAELRALQAGVTDPNFRIFTDRDTITVFNRDLFLRGRNIDELFTALQVSDPGHAFYLGRELAKAELAIALGKTYRQEGPLRFGYLTPDDPRPARRSRPRAAGRA
jgi:dihydropteroate synthase-like protein